MSTTTTRKDIKELYKMFSIKNYTFNDDMSIDVEGDVDISGVRFCQLPIKFNNIMGNFNCAYNCLTTLENGPRYVSEVYFIQGNELQSFEDFPIWVGQCVFVYDNNFTSIDYLPEDENEYLIEVEEDVQTMMWKFKRMRAIENIINN